MTDDQVQILVALNDTPASFKALHAAVKHVLSLKSKYKLYLIHFIALNPPQNFPYLDHLDKGFNLEIQEEEEKIVDILAQKLQEKYYGKVNYSFIKVEGNGEVGPIIEEYIQSQLPNLDMLYVGTRNHGALKRWALGSVSDYLIHHVNVPITVVKEFKYARLVCTALSTLNLRSVLSARFGSRSLAEMSLLFLIILGVIMTSLTFTVGLLPLIASLKLEYMSKITIVGAGLLIGTALGVIIPEGTVIMVKAAQHVEQIVAVCLISGFTIMLLVEYITSLVTHTDTHSKNRNTMIGILIHSMADGVALASVAMSDHASLEMIVFLAIIIHKLPAAFGISCFLMGNGENRSRIKRFQLLFSISAPLASILTWVLFNFLKIEDIQYFSGIMLLVSGGSFLNVATMHILPEVLNDSASGSHAHSGLQSLQKLDLAALIGSMYLPILLTAGHSH